MSLKKVIREDKYYIEETISGLIKGFYTRVSFKDGDVYWLTKGGSRLESFQEELLENIL